MVMDNYHNHDPLQESFNQIQSLHLSYLELDESPQKIEHKNKLQKCIENFLSLAPHNKKFLTGLTADVLHHSASLKENFSAYRAANGFDAINRYASNLLSKPWRKEYRKIKTYSGFYKHEIDSNLERAEVLFEAMGYKMQGDGVLVLEGPICPDRVSDISLDSLIAYVECQILKTIWEEVCLVYKASWMEVLHFRETYLYAPKDSAEALIYMHRQRQYQELHNYPPNIDTSNGWKVHQHQQHALPVSHMYPTMPTHPHQVTHMPMGCMYSCCNPGAFMPYYYPMSYVPVRTSLPPPPPLPLYPYKSVPTGQLIELEQHAYDTVDAPRRKESMYVQDIDRKMRQMLPNDSLRRTPSEPKNSDREEGSGTWDYVYRDLEGQGYYKDLGSRGDILNQHQEDKRHNHTKARHPARVDDSSNPEVVYRNVEAQAPKELYKRSDIIASAPLVEEKRTKSRKSENQYETVDRAKEKKFDTPKTEVAKVSNTPKTVETRREPDRAAGWECTFCTFRNEPSTRICKMCAKTKENAVADLSVGGHECKHCTYINAKNVNICEMCTKSLHDSPTYI